MRRLAKEQGISLPFREGRRTWYLALQIGFPADSVSEVSRKDRHLYNSIQASSLRHLKVVSRECKRFGVTIRRLNISVDDQGAVGHYLFRFRQYQRDDDSAIRLAEAFAFEFSLAGGPLVETNDSLVLRVPDIAIRGKHSLNFETLVAIEKSRPPQQRSLSFPNARLASVTSTTCDLHEIAWRVAAVTFRDAGLFDATRFLLRSYENFYVYPGQLREVIYEPVRHTSGTAQNDFEDALHSAFKAIEAIIGDPPKDDGKFFRKLQQIGIDPQEEVGYLDKIPIERMIRRMNEARDKKSAHGSTRNRTISPAELLEFQTCAEIVVRAGVEKARGSPLDGF